MMNKKGIYILGLSLVIALGAVFVLPGSAVAQVVCVAANVNNQVLPNPAVAGVAPLRAGHIFCGNVNGEQNSTGFHSRPLGHNPATVDHIGGGPNPVPGQPGLYRLTGIAIIQAGAVGHAKPLSTMFPDHCSQDNVMDAIRHAAANLNGQGVGPSGPSCQTNGALPHDFDIRVIVDGNGTIVTAYPNY